MTLYTNSDETFVLSAHSSIIQKAFENLKQTAQKRPVLIAISGESASGKTTFLNTLKRILKGSVFIDADNYFIDLSEQIKRHGSFCNLLKSGFESDAPSSFMLDTLYDDLAKLRSNREVYIPRYQMNGGYSIPKDTKVSPAPFIFTCGICTLYKPVVDLFDFKIYLQADKELQYKRYLARAHERGQTEVQAANQFKIVSDMAQKYIIPTKQEADIVVKGRLPNHTLKRLFIDTIRQMG
jgi:uridine kinase